MSLTDADIVEIRDELLPSQGESFDCIAFTRAVLARSNTAEEWRPHAIAWLRRKAAEQAVENARFPRHAECYPSWVRQVTILQRLADELQPPAPALAELKPTHSTVPQLLARAALDRDPISVFQDGTSNADSNTAIFVVKGKAHIDYIKGLAEQQRLLTPGKPVVGEETA